MQIEKLNNQWKTYHLQKLKEKSKFLMHITILKTGTEFFNTLKNLISLFGYLRKIGRTLIKAKM